MTRESVASVIGAGIAFWMLAIVTLALVLR